MEDIVRLCSARLPDGRLDLLLVFTVCLVLERFLGCADLAKVGVLTSKVQASEHNVRLEGALGA